MLHLIRDILAVPGIALLGYLAMVLVTGSSLLATRKLRRADEKLRGVQETEARVTTLATLVDQFQHEMQRLSVRVEELRAELDAMRRQNQRLRAILRDIGAWLVGIPPEIADTAPKIETLDDDKQG